MKIGTRVKTKPNTGMFPTLNSHMGTVTGFITEKKIIVVQLDCDGYSYNYTAEHLELETRETSKES